MVSMQTFMRIIDCDDDDDDDDDVDDDGNVQR